MLALHSENLSAKVSLIIGTSKYQTKPTATPATNHTCCQKKSNVDVLVCIKNVLQTDNYHLNISF